LEETYNDHLVQLPDQFRWIFDLTWHSGPYFWYVICKT